MLKPIIKENGITPGERKLAKLADSAFVGLWSYPNVYRDEGITKNGVGQESGDLFVYFENTLVIFSEKDIAFKDKGNIKVAWGRWFRASIKESIVQLRGAESFVKNYPNRFFLDKLCKEPFPFDLSSSQLKIHLVAITRNSYEPARKYFDSVAKGSSGSLQYVANLNEEELLDKPFHITDFDTEKTFVHVFDEFAFDLLVAELNTTADFIHYLQTKEKAIRQQNLILIPGEEDFLAYYLAARPLSNFGYGDFIAPAEEGYAVVLQEGEWNTFRESKAYDQHGILREKTRGWLTLLELFSRSILNAEVGEGIHLPLLEHERALRCMASENTFSRSILYKTLMEKYEQVPTNARSARLIRSPCESARLYVFLFFPRDKSHIDYEHYRQERTACMQLYAYVARHKMTDIKEILVFGADTRGSQEASETIIAIDASKPMTAEEHKEAEHIMNTHNILNTFFNAERIAVASPIRKKIRAGRNVPCPCGSGKKNKYCCQYF